MYNKLSRIHTQYLHQEPLAMLTAYDYSFAALESSKGVDMILVGDSANFVLKGKSTTRGITLEEMAQLTERVARGVQDYGNFSLVIGDLPQGSYNSVEQAVQSAQAMRNAGADAVKLEGGTEKNHLQEAIKNIVARGIPVQGHLGYTPQSESFIDKGHYQGKSLEAIEKLVGDMDYLQKAGVFSIVLECVPWQVAKLLTERATVPTIGIGSGTYCNGQVLVVYDLLGLTPGINGEAGKLPKFVWQYSELSATSAIAQYVADVKERKMPSLEQSVGLKERGILEKLKMQEIRKTAA